MQCSVEGCDNEVECKQLCWKHYSRLRRYGDPTVVSKRGKPSNAWGSIEDRIKDKYVIEPSGCWRWTGACNENSYGILRIAQKNQRATRLIYNLHHPDVSIEGLDLDHFKYPQDGCIGPACVNPEHLEPKSHKANSLRSDSPPAMNARKTHCSHGHEFTEENTRRRPSRPDKRDCIKCEKIRYRNRHDSTSL